VKPTELEEAQVGTRVRVQLDYRDLQQQGPIRHAFAAGASGAELAPIHRTAQKSSSRESAKGGLPETKRTAESMLLLVRYF
jgi:hypothetical protein